MKRAIIRLFLVSGFVLGLGFHMQAQAILTQVGDHTFCPDTVVVPIMVQNVDNVYTISLKLDHDTSKWSYTGYQNLHPALASGFFSVGSVNNQLGLSWFSLSEAEIASDTLVELIIEYRGGYCNLAWDTLNGNNCVYSDFLGASLPADYDDGSITSPGPYLVHGPSDTTVIEGDGVSFTANVQLADTLAWQCSVDGGNHWFDVDDSTLYSGMSTNTLVLDSTSASMHGNLYRLRATGICPDLYTNPVMLGVVPSLPVITTHIGQHSFCNGNFAIPVLVNNYINVSSFNLKLNFNDAGNVLTYTGYSGVNPNLSGGTLTINASGNSSLSVSYNTSGGTNLSNDTLFYLEFSSQGGTSSLEWDTSSATSCQYENPNGFFFPLILQNGQVAVEPIPQAPNMPGGPSSLCPGVTSTQISTNPVTNANSYSWMIDPASAGTISGDSNVVDVNWDPGFSGYATITVQAISDCGISNPSPGLIIMMDSLPAQPDTPSGTSSLCADAPNSTYSVPFLINALDYEWEMSPSNAGVLIPNSNYASIDWNNGFSGQVYLKARASNTCGDGPFSDSLMIEVHAAVIVDLGADQTICVNQSVSLDAGNPGASYLWSTGDTNQILVVDTSSFNIGTHNIVVRALSPSGCMDFDTINVTIDPCVGMEEVQSPGSFTVFPNPGNGKVRLLMEDWPSGQAEIAVYNMSGAVVYKEAIDPGSISGLKQIDLTGLSHGIYYLQISSQAYRFGKPLIIKD